MGKEREEEKMEMLMFVMAIIAIPVTMLFTIKLLDISKTLWATVVSLEAFIFMLMVNKSAKLQISYLGEPSPLFEKMFYITDILTYVALPVICGCFICVIFYVEYLKDKPIEKKDE